jgi:hypothetical protein
MTAFRLISLPTHAVVELMVGFALLAAPFALGFEAGGLLAAVLLGVLLTGLALAAAENLAVASHLSADYALIVALLAGALALKSVGDGTAALTFLAAGIVELALALTTRYSRGPAVRRRAT